MAEAKSELKWTYVPLKARIGTLIFLAVLVPVLAVLVYLESHNVIVMVLAVAFLAVAVSPAILPAEHVLDESGVAVRHFGKTIGRPWSEVKRLVVDPEVLVLSPSAKPGFLDSFRGIHLRFNRDQEAIRDEALKYIMARIPRRHETGG
jgi:hypothetical protein